MPIVINKTNELYAQATSDSRYPERAKRQTPRAVPQKRNRLNALVVGICALVVVLGALLRAHTANAQPPPSPPTVIAMNTGSQGEENTGAMNMLRAELHATQ